MARIVSQCISLSICTGELFIVNFTNIKIVVYFDFEVIIVHCAEVEKINYLVFFYF